MFCLIAYNLFKHTDCHRFTHEFIFKDTDLQKSTDFLLNPFFKHTVCDRVTHEFISKDTDL